MDYNYTRVDIPNIEQSPELRDFIYYVLNRLDSRYLALPAPLASALDLDNPASPGAADPDNKSLQSVDPVLTPLSLSEKQVNYLTARLHGKTLIEFQNDNALSAVELVLWQDNPLFSACDKVLKQADALQAKAMNTHKATKDPEAFLDRIAFIKSIDPSFREGAAPPARQAVNVQVVLVDGRTERIYDVSASQTDKPDQDT